MSLQQAIPAEHLLADCARAPHAPWLSLEPVHGQRLTLRELRPGDASSLARCVTTPSVTRFLYPPPDSAQRFRAFIQWARGEQHAGRQCCFAVVPHAADGAAGLIQVRRLDDEGACVEWGFVLGEPFWGTGVFLESAVIVLDHLLTSGGVRRIEARTALANGRGNGVLKKLGFVRERVGDSVLDKGDAQFEEALWTTTEARWKMARPAIVRALTMATGAR